MQLTVHLNRDSVHAGDDLVSHSSTIDCDSEFSIAELIQKVKQTYLPGIAGGEATWIVSCSGNGPSPLGVVAQQWSQPKLRVPPETPISQALGTSRPSITFEYWCQKNPQLIFDRIAAEEEPPPKW